jgi:hypothetical protein
MKKQLPTNYCGEMWKLNVPLYEAFLEARSYFGSPKIEKIKKAIAKTDTRTIEPDNWKWR